MAAFVPISVSTQIFSSSRMSSALLALKENYDSFIFLIADRLQTYNDAASLKSEKDVYRILAQKPSSIFMQRVSWLEKVLTRCHIDKRNTQILSIDDIADSEAFLVLRQLFVLYNLNGPFQTAIEEEAFAAVDRKHSYRSYDIAQRLSRFYLLEELAINLGVRNKFKVYDEFYLGPTMPVFRELMLGKFSWFLMEANVLPGYCLSQARFFEWRDHSGWQQA